MFDTGSVVGSVPGVRSDSAWQFAQIRGCAVGVTADGKAIHRRGAPGQGDPECCRGDTRILLLVWMVLCTVMADKE